MRKHLDLSKKGNLIFFFCIIILYSCSRETSFDSNSCIFSDYQAKNFDKYIIYYKICNDTINRWKNDSVELITQCTLDPYKLDSIIVFNNDSTRLFTTVNISSALYKNSVMDYVKEFGGAKINGNWYFFFGASMPVPREMFSDKIYEPLSFDQLSKIAHKHRFPKMQLDSNGKYVIDEQFFIDNVMNPRVYGCYDCDTKEKIDSFIVAYCKAERLKKLDPEEIKRIKSEMAATRKPLEPRRDWFGLGKFKKEDLENPRYP